MAKTPPVQTTDLNDANSVLSKRQLGEINRGLSAVDAAVKECDLAESCGNDCETRREELEAIRTQLNLFKSTYFPGAK
jgi:hypothetical protein